MGREQAFVDHRCWLQQAILDAAEHVTRMLGGIKLAPSPWGGAAPRKLCYRRQRGRSTSARARWLEEAQAPSVKSPAPTTRLATANQST
jgi:hypothetical protein